MSHLGTNIDTVLVEKTLKFKLAAANYVHVYAGETQGFSSLHPPRACWHISPRRGWRSPGQPEGRLPLWGGRRWTWEIYQSAPQFMDGKVIEAIRNFLECGGGTLVWDHQVGGLWVVVFRLAAAFYLDFPAAGLGAVVFLALDFCVLPFFLVAVRLGCSEVSLTGREGGFVIGVEE